MNRSWRVAPFAFALLAFFTNSTAPLPAAQPAPKPPESSSYGTWKYQANKQRYWCTYNYRNGAGRQAYQYVLYYPETSRNNVYYFQNRSGQIWACCVRPGAANFSDRTTKWYRKSGDRWVRRADGECPQPPDGGDRIAIAGGGTLPLIPTPKEFETLSADDRAVAEAFHKLLATVTVEGKRVVGLDFGGSERLDNDGLAGLKGLTSLRRLFLDSTKIGDEGLAHLAALEKLEHLDLSQTEVTLRGLKHLGGVKSLRTLIIRGCPRVRTADTWSLKQANRQLLVTGP